jgi:DNA-binding response OmpR family regulator
MAAEKAAPIRVVVVGGDRARIRAIQDVLGASFEAIHVTSGWDAQRQLTSAPADALVVHADLVDTDAATLLARLRQMGVTTPVVLLAADGSSPDRDTAADEHVPEREALLDGVLARAIRCMLTRHELRVELARAREKADAANRHLGALVHELATPLGVISVMARLLRDADIALDEEDRACLVDINDAARRASDILIRAQERESGSADACVSVPATSPASMSNREVQTRSRLVLVADDDDANRRLVSRVIASDHYGVLQAADGEEAWRLIRQHRPELVILDWQMPVYSGLELTDVIKGDPRCKNTTVIMLTGRSTPADRAAGERARADLYLTKPFEPIELISAVRTALRLPPE